MYYYVAEVYLNVTFSVTVNYISTSFRKKDSFNT